MKYFFLGILFLSPFSFPFSSQTRFIVDRGFQGIWLGQLTKTCVSQEKGISLSYDSEKKYECSSNPWSATFIDKNLYIGSSETASLIKLNTSFEEEILYSNPEKSMITAISKDGNGLLFAISPETELIHLDKNKKVEETIDINHEYVWDIIVNPSGGHTILTGRNAAVYNYKNSTLSKAIPIDNEEHLLKGLYIGKTLWVLGEKGLYKQDGDRFIALTSFDGTASGFIYHKDRFYVITSWNTPSNPGEEEKENLLLAPAYAFQEKDKEKGNLFSGLFSITLDGKIEKLASVRGLYFTSIDVSNEQILVGGDQFGFYLSYDLIMKKSIYSSIGEGRITKILTQDSGEFYLLTSDPGNIFKSSSRIAKEGFFISSIYDAKNTADWGVFEVKGSLPMNTEAKFFIQSGTLPDPSYWSDWQEIFSGDKIPAKNTRFLRYKILLSSLDGKTQPYIHQISFPFTELNLPPSITYVNIEQKNSDIVLNWEASDPNGDKLEYDVYFAEEGLPKIKMTKTPLIENHLSFPSSLIPSGFKCVTIVASDRPSNSDMTALEDRYTSSPILFDCEAPSISEISVQRKKNLATISFSVEDKYSNIKEVYYIKNASDQVFLQPKDGLFDGKYKEFEVSIPLSEKATFIQIHAVDSHNNCTYKGITILNLK